MLSVFASQKRTDYGALRLISVGGEAMAPEGLQKWENAGMGGIQLLNAYGPTEATVPATSLDCGGYKTLVGNASSAVPIG